MAAVRHQSRGVALWPEWGTLTSYPFRAPAVRPDMMLRWKIRKKTIVGSAAMADAAMIMFCGVVDTACQMPTLSVSRLGLYPPSTSSGQRKSFQTATTAKMETTPRIGRDMGSTTLRRVRSGDAPSIADASISSLGIESKNRLSRKILKALATDGSQMASGVPIRFRCRIGRLATVRYRGTTRTVDGIINVASIMRKMAFPRTGRSLESA